jgi:hypothetical protein
MNTTERAVLAGGCFWGMQDLIRKMNGVVSTRVGYSGGDVPNATYRKHGTHAEAIEIVFDPAKLSYRELLEFFFQIHDPTTRNRRRHDCGRECIEVVAGTRRHRGGTGRPVLGGGAGAPGLSGAHTERLHVPFRTAELEAACQAEANRISSKLRSLRRFAIRD